MEPRCSPPRTACGRKLVLPPLRSLGLFCTVYCAFPRPILGKAFSLVQADKGPPFYFIFISILRHSLLLRHHKRRASANTLFASFQFIEELWHFFALVELSTVF